MKNLFKRIFAFVLVFALAITMVACGEEPVKEPQEFTLEWDLAGGSSSVSMQVSFKEGETVELPTLKKDGYTFVGWTENGELVTTVTEANHKFVAKFEVIKYTANLNLDGGTCDKTKVEFEYGKALEATLPTPTKEGYEFLGWYEGEAKVVKLTENKNYELTAKWELIQNYGGLEFELDGGEFDVEATIPVSYLEGSELELPVPTKRGYEFLGWYVGETKYEKILADSKGDIKLTAKWNKVDVFSQIFLDVKGGSLEPMEGLVTGDVAILTYKEGVEITLPTPTKAMAEFVGWYDETGVFYTTISVDQIGELVLTAQWKEFYASIGEQTFSSINEAIAAAKDGDTIVLASCEINDPVDINKTLTIVGKYKDANRKVEHEINDDESMFMAPVTVSAPGVVINGVKFGGDSGLIVNENNVEVLSCFFELTGNYPKTIKENRQGMLVECTENGISDLLVKDCFFRSKKAKNDTADCFMSFEKITNFTMDNCACTNVATAFQNDREGLNTYHTYGTFTVKNCEFTFAIYSYTLMIGRNSGGWGNDCTEINIIDNVFSGRDGYSTSAFKIGAAKPDCVINIIGNEFNDMNPDAKRSICIAKDSTLNQDVENINILYNYFNEKEFIDCDNTTVKPNINNNMYNAGSTVDATTQTVYTTKEELAAGYAEYKANYISNGTKVYKTLAEALAEAQEGDTLVLKAYNITEENIDINKSVTILGPKANVDRKANNKTDDNEAVFTTPVKITANNVVLNGLKFTDAAAITVSGNNTKILSCYVAPTGTYAGGWNGNNRRGAIADGKAITDLLVKDTYILTKGTSSSSTNTFMTFEGLTNFEMDNCLVENNVTTPKSGYEGYNGYTNKGTFVVKNSEFHFNILAYLFVVGRSSNGLTKVEFVNNVFKGNGLQTGAIDVRKCACDVEIIGNEFYDVYTDATVTDNTKLKGTINFSSYSKGNVTIKYNYFEEPFLFNSTVTPACDFNCYAGGTEYTNAGETKYNTLEEVKAAYKAFLESSLFTITFDAAGGNDVPVLKFADFSEVVLPVASKEGYVFLGWFEGDNKVESITENKHYELVAHWEALPTFTVTYDTDGGNTIEAVTFTDYTAVQLPTPVKENAVFLGWFVEETQVTALTENANITLKAHWRELQTLEVGADKTYKTVAEALAVADNGDTIVIYAGTYAETLTIAKELTIKGPNANVNGRVTASSGALLAGTITLDSDNITFDGVDFSGDVDSIVVPGTKVLKNITFDHIYSTANPQTANKVNDYSKVATACGEAASYLRKAVIFVQRTDSAKTIENFTVKNSAFIMNGAEGTVAILLNNRPVGLVLENNLFDNGKTSTVENEAFLICRTGANIAIENNTFNWSTSSVTFALGLTRSSSNNAKGTFDITGNTFDGGANGVLGLHFGTIRDDILVNVVNNTFTNGQNSTQLFNFDNLRDSTKLQANISYNYFDATVAFKVMKYDTVLTNAAAQQISIANNAILGTIAEDCTIVVKDDTNNNYTDKESVYAAYVEANPELKKPRIGNTRYDTLDAALAAANDGDTIVLVAGEYTISANITKSVTIEGPNKGIKGYDASRKAEAIITASSIKLDCANIKFDGVEITGGGNANPFYSTNNTKNVQFVNCFLTNFNSFFRAEATTDLGTISFVDNYFTVATQFIFWNKAGTVEKFDFIGNKVCESGTVGGEGIIRVCSSGAVTIMNNYFDSVNVERAANARTWFQTRADVVATIKYNTFVGDLARIASTAAEQTGTMNFDQNLYIDASGATITDISGMPHAAGNTTTGTALADEAARSEAYANYLAG